MKVKVTQYFLDSFSRKRRRKSCISHTKSRRRRRREKNRQEITLIALLGKKSHRRRRKEAAEPAACCLQVGWVSLSKDVKQAKKKKKKEIRLFARSLASFTVVSKRRFKGLEEEKSSVYLSLHFLFRHFFCLFSIPLIFDTLFFVANILISY